MDFVARRFLEKLPAGHIDISQVVAAHGPVNVIRFLRREMVCRLADGNHIHIDQAMIGDAPKISPISAADAFAWQLLHSIVAPSAALAMNLAAASPKPQAPTRNNTNLTDTDKAILRVANPKRPLSGRALASGAGYAYDHVRHRLPILVKGGWLRKGKGGRGYLKSL